MGVYAQLCFVFLAECLFEGSKMFWFMIQKWVLTLIGNFIKRFDAVSAG